ncbi:MAG: hypothetical protein A2744_02000 [Candidatus Buchananbacteria bacterium RIFCSPHIGHO2_01_FULL_44_11]|uniref:Uncharacterized protein n=1 Tax=Candidatus Buchananbacteria bacterium RIFCSPHIGHO2_01_FULL_44_11 TaxID=1797535 RepID=A0A1G1Y1A2_9BACT|nr:MAG: hypothetical protein A2744_02000 [Candidatus Buchananbacteria bacterium RIFCSPHIGHO2_01_FULL_44_11]
MKAAATAERNYGLWPTSARVVAGKSPGVPNPVPTLLPTSIPSPASTGRIRADLDSVSAAALWEKGAGFAQLREYSLLDLQPNLSARKWFTPQRAGAHPHHKPTSVSVRSPQFFLL